MGLIKFCKLFCLSFLVLNNSIQSYAIRTSMNLNRIRNNNDSNKDSSSPKNVNEYGSIRDAEVVQLIEFMAKDIPAYQKPLKNGLKWIDNESQIRFEKLFIDLLEENQKEIFDEIAYYDPNKNISDYSEEIQWFNLVRNLTMTGYFTSNVGIKELGYKGNTPNVWDGVPQDVLDQYDLSYDKEWIDKCIDQSKRDDIAVWDQDGNLIT